MVASSWQTEQSYPLATSWRHLSAEQIIADKDVEPIRSVTDLNRYAVDIWESDEELAAFLADVRANRNADLS